MEVKCYFPEQQETKKDTRVHAIDVRQHPEFTLCGMAFEEWDCFWNKEDIPFEECIKDRITDKHITCNMCITVLEELQIFKKTEKGWV